MARVCIICGHPKRREIEQKLASGVPYSALLVQYGLSKGGISRHVKNHFDVIIIGMQHNVRMGGDPFYPRMRVGGLLVGSPSVGCEFWRGSDYVSGEQILGEVLASVAEANKPFQAFGYSVAEARKLQKRAVK